MKILKLASIVLLSMGAQAMAQDPATPPQTYEAFQADPAFPKFMIDNLWILISTALVFIMHLGFCTLESGLCQKKNTVNILFKNVFIVAMGLVGYYLWGFNSHYPGDAWTIENFLAFGKPAGYAPEAFDANNTAAYSAGTYTYWTDFIFQGMFAATAATIVSGAVAERIKLGSFLVYATLLVVFVYPFVGSWHWGGGFLKDKGFYDFAGSAVVHAFGGFAALAAILVLGPRRGKFTKDGIKPILPSNLPMATIGVMLLWFGWFGFNGGSVLSADPALVSYVFVTTSLAAAAGALASTFTSMIVLKKPDLSMALNGILAGLVGITAGADKIPVPMSLLVGAIAGVIVVFAILALDKFRMDDPVGAVAVHGVCGIWGTLAVGIFAADPENNLTLGTQALGILCVGATAFIASFLLMMGLKFTMGIRVDPEVEAEGLDVEEHGSPAYADMA